MITWSYSLSIDEINWLFKHFNKKTIVRRNLEIFETEVKNLLYQWCEKYNLKNLLIRITVFKKNIQIVSKDRILGGLLLRTIQRPFSGLPRKIPDKPLPPQYEDLLSEFSQESNMSYQIINEIIRDVTVFVSHASEDKDSFVRPLANILRDNGLTIWYDEFDLNVGDSLRQEIDKGLSICDYGIVVLSPSFFAKKWPQWELDGLVAKEMHSNKKVILPIWHKIGFDDIIKFSPPLANRKAVPSLYGIKEVSNRIVKAIVAQKNVTKKDVGERRLLMKSDSRYRDGYWDLNVTDCGYVNKKGWEYFLIRGRLEFFGADKSNNTPYDERKIGDIIFDINPSHNIKVRFLYTENIDFIDYISYNEISQVEISGDNLRLLALRNAECNPRILLSFHSSFEEEIISEILKIRQYNPHIRIIDDR